MKSKAKILIVEDKSIIYKRLKMVLSENLYTVYDYCPSVEEAIKCINKESPDLVLLDIDLQGDHDGIYLGALLRKDYKIPFIYVTDYEDEEIFHRLKETLPSDYITKNEINLKEESNLIVATKPVLEEKRVLRAIQLELERNKKVPNPIIKDGIMAYMSYVKETKQMANSDVQRIPIAYKDIAYFTSNSDKLDEVKTKEKNRDCYQKLKPNNTRIYTWNKKSFYVPTNLAPILKNLPNNFIRISEDYIVNIDNEVLEGRINGNRLKICSQTLYVSERYKKELENRLSIFYEAL